MWRRRCAGPRGVTHRVAVGVSLFLHHRREPNHGDDGVQHEGEEEVLVQRYPLAAQTPARGGRLRLDVDSHLHHFDSNLSRRTYLKWKNIPNDMNSDTSDRP